MKDAIPIKNGITIPEHELLFTTSRAGGPGGQHVNKTNTKVTLHWNIRTSQALTEEQKIRIMNILSTELTTEGELVIQSSSSRSQHQNKHNTIHILIQKIRKALYIPKKRIATVVSQHTKEKRLQKKKQHSQLKKMRKVRI